MLNVPGGRFGHNHIQHQMDLAARAEAKRLRDEGYAHPSNHVHSGHSRGIVGFLGGFVFGLVVMGLMVYMAWQSGLLGSIMSEIADLIDQARS